MRERHYDVEHTGTGWVVVDFFGNPVSERELPSSLDAVKEAMAFQKQDETLDRLEARRLCPCA